MKIIDPGHPPVEAWSAKVKCTKLDCEALLEVDAGDLFRHTEDMEDMRGVPYSSTNICYFCGQCFRMNDIESYDSFGFYRHVKKIVPDYVAANLPTKEIWLSLNADVREKVQRAESRRKRGY